MFIVIIDMLCIVDGARAGPDGPKEAAFVCHIGVSGSKHQSPQSVTRYPKAILMLLSRVVNRDNPCRELHESGAIRSNTMTLLANQL